jgi:hypothetical protein
MTVSFSVGYEYILNDSHSKPPSRDARRCLTMAISCHTHRERKIHKLLFWLTNVCSRDTTMRSIALLSLLCLQPSFARIPLLNTAAGGLQNVGSLPAQVEGIVTVISSPGTPSALTRDEADADTASVLSAESNPSGIVLYCRGSTLSGTSQDDRTSLALCSVVSGSLLVDGVTVGDVQAGLQNSRHARTLTALFRSKIKLMEGDGNRQTLIIGLVDSNESDDEKLTESIVKDVKALYKASAVEKKGVSSFEEAYDLQILSVASAGQANSVSRLSVINKQDPVLLANIKTCYRLFPRRWRRPNLRVSHPSQWDPFSPRH